MTDLMKIIDNLSQTDAMLEQLARAREQNPDDEILQINAESIEKRRNDLIRRLDFALNARQADIVRYRIKRDWADAYPAKAVTVAIGAFQDLVTAVVDAVKHGPKTRFRPSQDSLEVSTFEFGGAGTGSVVVSLVVPNERLLVGETELNRTLNIIERTLSARESEDLSILAEEIGVAAITKAYAWAQASASYGLDTCIEWGESFTEVQEISISRGDAEIVKGLIENKSDKEEFPESLEGILAGFDGETSYFHIVTFDKELDIRGSVGPHVSKSWTTNKPYRADLIRRVQILYATGEEKVSWILVGLSPIIQDNDQNGLIE